ncbi:MAG: hypothetical protein AB7G06_08020 [Bdellovibrionales bacterium]
MNHPFVPTLLPPAIFWWPVAGVGAAPEAQNTILSGLFSVIHPDHAEFVSMGNWTSQDVLGRTMQSMLSIFALGAEDGLSAIQAFQLLQDVSRAVQLDPNLKASLAGRRFALVFSSTRSAQPNLTLESQLVPLLKKCGLIYLGAYWHYAGAHPGWRLQNGPKAQAFKGRVESEMQAMFAQATAENRAYV